MGPGSDSAAARDERLRAAHSGYHNGYDRETEPDQHHAYMVGFTDAWRQGNRLMRGDEMTSSEPPLQVGDYARIIAVPEAWEGSGEPPEDRLALLGHVGLVIEVPDGTDADDCALLRFPWAGSEGVTGQRNVELSALARVSSPPLAFPMSTVINSGPGPDEDIIIGDLRLRFVLAETLEALRTACQRVMDVLGPDSDAVTDGDVAAALDAVRAVGITRTRQAEAGR